MTGYNYIVRDANGKVLRSYCQAAGEAALRSQLKAMGYTVNAIVKRTSSRGSRRRKRIKAQDIVSMCRRFSIMYSAGLNLMDCLSSLAKENESKDLSDILGAIQEHIAEGGNLSDAFAKYPKVFSSFFVNMLRAGETTGKFDYILKELAEYIEKQHDLKRRIRGALAYPFIVLAMIFFVVTAIMIFVVPVFAKVYTELGIELPTPTVTLISISKNAAYIFPLIFISAGIIWALYKRVRNISEVRNFLDRIKLAVPAVGGVYHETVMLKFLRTLSLAVSAGIPLSNAVHISREVASNDVFSDAAEMIERSITRGGTITEAMKLHGFFPQSIQHAFAAGEKSGNLAEMLRRFSDGIEQDVNEAIKKLVMKIEPLIMVILSLIVGFVLLAIYLPIFDIMKLLNK